MVRMSSFFPLKAKEDVRAATCSPTPWTVQQSIFRDAVAEILILLVGAHVEKGSTAMDLLSWVRACGVGTVGRRMTNDPRARPMR